MEAMKLSRTLEAMLFACGEPIPAARVSLVLSVPEKEVWDCAEALAEEYEREERGFRLLKLGTSLQLCSAPEYAPSITRIMEHRAPPKLSAPALETLAIIAYFQPVTRAYVEQVRGAESSYTVSSLAEKGLVESCGRLDAPGRPTLFRTTDAFLRVMGLDSLDKLPKLPEAGSTEGLLKLQNAIEELKTRGSQMEIEV